MVSFSRNCKDFLLSQNIFPFLSISLLFLDLNTAVGINLGGSVLVSQLTEVDLLLEISTFLLKTRQSLLISVPDNR